MQAMAVFTVLVYFSTIYLSQPCLALLTVTVAVLLNCRQPCRHISKTLLEFRCPFLVMFCNIIKPWTLMRPVLLIHSAIKLYEKPGPRQPWWFVMVWWYYRCVLQSRLLEHILANVLSTIFRSLVLQCRLDQFSVGGWKEQICTKQQEHCCLFQI